MSKKHLYSSFIDRLELASKDGKHFESAWYSYAVIEDRLRSLLRLSGGDTHPDGKPIHMMGPKLNLLKIRSKTDAILDTEFQKPLSTLVANWAKARNQLMHAMADNSMSLEDIDAAAEQLAHDGQHLVRKCCTACWRVKKLNRTAQKQSAQLMYPKHTTPATKGA